MAKFVLLYHGGGMPESEAEQAKVMAAWGEWIKACGDSLVDVGNPTSNAKNVTSTGTADVSGDRVTGYSILKADSIEAAMKAAAMVPLVADGSGSCDVYETMDLM